MASRLGLVSFPHFIHFFSTIETMSYAATVVVYTAATSAGVFLLQHFNSKSVLAETEERPLPPSPTAYPWIGNLFSVPAGFEQHGYAQLGKELNSKFNALGWDIYL